MSDLRKSQKFQVKCWNYKKKSQKSKKISILRKKKICILRKNQIFRVCQNSEEKTPEI